MTQPEQPLSALEQIPAVTVEQLVASLAQALDLAEGRRKGHALRVCYIAASLARELALPRGQRSAVFFAALLHDAGVPRVSESLASIGRMYEHELFAASPLQGPDMLAARAGAGNLTTITEAFHDHCFEGASAIASLGLPPQVAEAVLCHHERHDGGGYPMGLAGSEVPAAARIIAVADYSESLLTADPNPLFARRHLDAGLREQSGRAFHPHVVDAMTAVARRDEFWLGFFDHALINLVSEFGDPDSRPLVAAATLRVTGAFADIVDSKNPYKRGHSRRVASHARALAAALGLDEGHQQAIELAALLHDIGMLRVPSRVIGKPEILTVQEMALLHEHPRESADILRTVPGWEPIADWVAGHHERLDGRGYPEGLGSVEIPLEARILATADIHEALTADRPHRTALNPKEALRVMDGLVGQNLDPYVFDAFREVASLLAEDAEAS